MNLYLGLGLEDPISNSDFKMFWKSLFLYQGSVMIRPMSEVLMYSEAFQITFDVKETESKQSDS